MASLSGGAGGLTDGRVVGDRLQLLHDVDVQQLKGQQVLGNTSINTVMTVLHSAALQCSVDVQQVKGQQGSPSMPSILLLPCFSQQPSST